MKLNESFIKRQHEYRGKAVGFRVDEIRLPNGKTAVREYLDHPGAVAVIPFLAPDKIVMVRQFRHPVGEATWEIPAGKMDGREPPLVCVKRELAEETGYQAGRIKKLLSFWPTPAFANEIIYIYTAEKLTAGASNPDADEFLNTGIWPLNRAYQAIKRGQIKDSKTIIALLAYTAFGKAP